MQVRIEKKPEIKIVGPVAITKRADSETIKGLWESLEKAKKNISFKTEDFGYELHIEIEENFHYCLTGLEVDEIKNLPLNCFAKTIPSGEYAIFAFEIARCGFKNAYEKINEWLKDNVPPGSENYKKFEAQVYDHRFKGMENPESIIEFRIPL